MFWQIIFLFSSSYALQEVLKAPSCTTRGSSRTIRLSVNSTRHPTGVWMDNVSAWTEMNNSSDGNNMDIAHTVTECQGKRILNIQAFNQASGYMVTDDRLKFHSRCGKNVAVLNKGLTVQKIKLDDPLNSVVFTNRPLKDDEIFEVKLEGRKSSFTYGTGIGFRTISPADIEILPEMYKSPFAWLYHSVHLYNNGVRVIADFGKDIYKLQVGDTIGVMRSEMGTLHVFVNGEDQGPVMSNVPPNIYGILDLRELYYRASMVYKS